MQRINTTAVKRLTILQMGLNKDSKIRFTWKI
jgi:hypothetical protein